MNCKQVQALLVAYLDGEVTPSERALIQAHLSGCTVCQQEFNLLFTAREQVHSVLQHRAAHAVPARDAWDRLEAGLTEAAQPSSSRFEAWFSRLAPYAGRASIRKFFGGLTMRKRLIASAFVVVAALSIFVILTARSVTSVSAQQILDRAYQAQSQQAPSQGIDHNRIETYSNFQALPENQGTDLITESYLDFQTGYFRNVTTDSRTGKVLDAFAFDGSNTYSLGHNPPVTNSSDPLTIYRSPQSRVSTTDQKLIGTGNESNSKIYFDQIRNDPNVQFIGQEKWADGRTVYVLRSEQPVKVIVQQPTAPTQGNSGQTPPMVTPFNPDQASVGQPTGLVTVYFDTTTYKMVGGQTTMEKDGKELLLNSQRVLVDEILPAGSSVAWDLSDVQGITIVDDPNGVYGDLLPETITPQELAAKTQSGYLLKTIPDGFSLEITAPPKQPANEPYIYIASYRTAANDYFVIQAAGPADVQAMTKEADETYTTASGLVVLFIKDISDPTGKQYTSAIVEAPDGTAFMVSSTLPRDTVKAWAEDLVPAK
jgi:hypothetical protein